MSTYLSFFCGSIPVVSEHSKLFQPAVTRSGITGASARWIASAFGGHRWLPNVVAFRITGVEDGALGNHDFDRLDHSLIVRNIRIDHLQQRQDGRRRARREGAIDEAVALRICFRVVEFDALVFDGDGHAHLEFRTLVTAVVIDRAFAGIGAVRDRRDLGFHHLARGLEQRALVSLEILPAIFLQQLDDAAVTDVAGADLRFHVVLHDIETDVGEDQIPNVFSQFSFLVNLDRRDAQRLLPHLDRVRIVAAGHRAADVGLVALDRGPGDQLALEEHRLVDRDVVVLVAEREHVVVEDDVAGMNIIAVVVADVFAHGRERERQDRQILRLLEHPAFGVVQAGDEVLRLAQDRRGRGLLHRDRHFVGDRAKCARIDGQQDRIDFHARASASTRARHD